MARDFWSQVDLTRGMASCWEWTGGKSNGYGYGWVDGKRWRAHRYAYTAIVGPIPVRLELDHLCRNRGCVNPMHLEPVTTAENLRRGSGWAGQNAQRETCIRGHELTSENTYISRGHRYCRSCRKAWRVAHPDYDKRPNHHGK